VGLVVLAVAVLVRKGPSLAGRTTAAASSERVVAWLLQVARVLFELDTKTSGLLALGASVFGSFAKLSFDWLLSKFEANKESIEANKESIKELDRKSEAALKRYEESIKELDRKSEAANKEVLDVLKNEHRTSAQDSKLSNYFVVVVAALSALAPGRS